MLFMKLTWNFFPLVFSYSTLLLRHLIKVYLSKSRRTKTMGLIVLVVQFSMVLFVSKVMFIGVHVFMNKKFYLRH